MTNGRLRLNLGLSVDFEDAGSAGVVVSGMPTVPAGIAADARARARAEAKAPSRSQAQSSGGFDDDDDDDDDAARPGHPKRAAGELPPSALEWGQGEAFVYDESFEHSLVHAGSFPAVVLEVDLWHPDLRASERLERLAPPRNVMENNPLEYADLFDRYHMPKPSAAGLGGGGSGGGGSGGIFGAVLDGAAPAAAALVALVGLYGYYKYLLKPQFNKFGDAMEARRKRKDLKAHGGKPKPSPRTAEEDEVRMEKLREILGNFKGGNEKEETKS
jgi:hypothetical protein